MLNNTIGMEIIKIQVAETSAGQASVSSTNKSQGEKMKKKSTDEESSEGISWNRRGVQIWFN